MTRDERAKVRLAAARRLAAMRQEPAEWNMATAYPTGEELAMLYRSDPLLNLQVAMRQGWNSLMCALHGHDLIDRGYGGPDSGCDDKECRRCGKYWRIPLY